MALGVETQSGNEVSSTSGAKAHQTMATRSGKSKENQSKQTKKAETQGHQDDRQKTTDSR